MSKTFSGEFDKFAQKIRDKENFAFARFSDGELHMMQNMYFKITEDHFIEGDKMGYCKYTEEEHKEFIPEEHQFYRDKLIEAFQFKKLNYFKGVCTISDVGENDFNWQLELNEGTDTDLTFSNLLINSNYPRFIQEIIPELKNREIVFIVNKNAKLDNLGLNIIKTFRVGSNCIVNDYDKVEEIKNWILDNNVENAVFLSSAASLSNFIIHECFKACDNNTYIDIGSTLNPFIGLQGWQYSRGYLQHYILGRKNRYGEQVDVW